MDQLRGQQESKGDLTRQKDQFSDMCISSYDKWEWASSHKIPED